MVGECGPSAQIQQNKCKEVQSETVSGLLTCQVQSVSSVPVGLENRNERKCGNIISRPAQSVDKIEERYAQR